MYYPCQKIAIYDLALSAVLRTVNYYTLIKSIPSVKKANNIKALLMRSICLSMKIRKYQTFFRTLVNFIEFELVNMTYFMKIP